MVIEDLALLFIRGLGSRGIVHLIDHFGTAEEIYSAPLHTLINQAGLRKDVAERIVAREGMQEAKREIEYCRKNQIYPIAATDEEYPEALRETSDRPHVLFARGNIKALNMRTLSMVGTREASPSGIHSADKIIAGLATQIPNLCFISGLAYGIDSACHRSALAHNATTVAVVADILPNVSPAPNRNLADEILRMGGAIVSELHSQTKQNGQLFIARNRIVAGMADAVVVVESKKKGGSLITADMAVDYARDVFALPGRVDDICSAGCNDLIKRNKAQLIEHADDLILAMQWQDITRKQPLQTTLIEMTCQLSNTQQLLLQLLREADEGLHINQIVMETQLAYHVVASELVMLELQDVVKSMPGGMWRTKK